ncbi:DUF1499 domain-containing protein [Sulfitobacter sp. F26204]|uniref:DUF1499 domain-containing protein n=1 Tax=Sulfitobacter sp. F26204 TaxID=2996014 RepID=UPI00225E576A|nr:DUF1499 domain-containing protein [Sulfitobacter sp. F26204]MCX7559589.1 DUF1499 domain-containing protein [Sulfitobacter sp. F26204]
MMIWAGIGAGVAVLGYVRFAPFDPDRWHRRAGHSGMGELQGRQSYVWRAPVENTGAGLLKAMANVMEATPRTQAVAGSLKAGQMTFVSRSLVFGLPDYTTIGVYRGSVEEGGQSYFEIFGRARFGRSDFGINAKRIKGWRAVVQGG